MPGYEGADGSTPGGGISGAVAPTNRRNGLSGAPGKGSGGGAPGKFPVRLPPKLFLLLL